MFYHTTKTHLESDIDKCFLTILIILQIGFEPQWMHYLKTYVAPIANYIFTGYYSEVRSELTTTLYKVFSIEVPLEPTIECYLRIKQTKL